MLKQEEQQQKGLESDSSFCSSQTPFKYCFLMRAAVAEVRFYNSGNGFDA
jgi:hypothetical protein